MRLSTLPCVLFAALVFGLAVYARAESDNAVSSEKDTFFVENVFPVLRAAQCDLCHNDNGVASGYGLEFPSRNASREQILAFGYSLTDYVDATDPEESLLLQKPTNREEHTGGERIIPRSKQEQALKDWIVHLANLSDAEQKNASELISRASQWGSQPLSVRRLTHSQYNNTVRDLLGDQSQPASKFPKEDYVRGFKNQIEAQGISPLQAEAYSEAAERLARNAFRGGDHNNLIPQAPSSATDIQATEAFIRHAGSRAFRRPLSNDEVENYLKLFQLAATQSQDFNAGAQLVIETMLQSPHFLFRVSLTQDRGPNPYAIASQLSYLLWDTMPDSNLMQLAAQGKLSNAADIEAQARTMLDDPRAVVAMDEFLAQWMRFEDVTGATRDRRKFRDFNAEVASAMTEETRQLFRHLVWGNLNFMEFFSADYTFVSSSLARLYGLPAPPDEFARVEYPADSGRAGVLGHGSFLLLTSKPGETSPTERGIFIRNHFLSQEIAPPPPGVNSVLPEILEDKPMTNRQRLDIHLNSEACSGCHRLVDPIGFGFEQYDAIGRFQEKAALRFGGRNNAKTIELELDTTAYVQGIVDSSFQRPKELGRILANNETCQRSIVKQFFRYTFGRAETSADQPIIDTAYHRFRDSNFQFREIIVSFVTSPLFIPPLVEQSSVVN